MKRGSKMSSESRAKCSLSAQRRVARDGPPRAKCGLREEAQALGLTQYFTGRPCKWGHISPRFTVSRNCRACTIQKARDLRVHDPERGALRARNLRARDPEKARRMGRELRARDPERARRVGRERYARDPETARRKQNEARARDPEKVRQRERNWYNRDPEKHGKKNRSRRFQFAAFKEIIPGATRSMFSAFVEMTGLRHDS